jgi:predicted ester cyclase
MEVAMGADIKALAKKTIEELFDLGHLSFLNDVSELCFVGHDPLKEKALSLGEEKQIASAFRKAFPDLRCAVEDAITEGEQAACRWRMAGTHEGPFLGREPSGKRVSFEGITIMRFHGGRLAEEWTQYDTLALLSQLGVLPTLREVAGDWDVPAGADVGVGI